MLYQYRIDVEIAFQRLNKCFSIVYRLQDTEEYKLPTNLPVTTRMLHKANKANADPFIGGGGLSHVPLPALPAIRRSESFMSTVAAKRLPTGIR